MFEDRLTEYNNDSHKYEIPMGDNTFTIVERKDDDFDINTFKHINEPRLLTLPNPRYITGWFVDRLGLLEDIYYQEIPAFEVPCKESHPSIVTKINSILAELTQLGIYYGSLAEDLRLLRNEIDARIPKKKIVHNDYKIWIECPRCHKAINKDNYCSHCGQALI